MERGLHGVVRRVAMALARAAAARWRRVGLGGCIVLSTAKAFFSIKYDEFLGHMASLARLSHDENNRRQYKANLNLTVSCRSASEKCEYLMIVFQRKRRTLFGLFCVILLVEIAYIATSWDRAVFMMQSDAYPKKRTQLDLVVVFFSRLALMILTVLFLALLRCKPVGKEEQKLLHSVLFDHYLEQADMGSQCAAIQVCFDTHAQRCDSEFTHHQMTFMQIMCFTSALHGSNSTISSMRTRGLLQLLFMRLWPMSAQEKDVALRVKRALEKIGVRGRLSVLMRVAANTSIMELAAWMGLLLYAHTTLSDGAVTYSWTGLYEELLLYSKFPSWNNSRGQDPRYLKDLLYLMSDALVASLAFCSLFPIPVSSSIILLLPVMLVIQVSFETQPDAIRLNQTSPVLIGQSQLYLLVSFYVLQRHNLQLLRNYRNDYQQSFRQRLDFLPQGLGHAFSNPARNRMFALAQKILSIMSRMEASDAPDFTHKLAPSQQIENSSVVLAEQSANSPASLEQVAACSAISTLVSYLQHASTAASTVCNLFDICKAAITQCEPLLKKRSVALTFLGRKRFLPLRVLLVDDSVLVRRFLERLARNRGYYYLSCSDGDAGVKAFEETLRSESSAQGRFDLILMDKDMPISDQNDTNVHKTAGASAVKRIRELCRLQAEVEPGFRCPCIIGNSACSDEDDPTWIQFCEELGLARQQAGMPSDLLILKEKMSSWSNEFDMEVRRLCGLNYAPASEASDAPTVWGNAIRLEMMLRNLITNAIQHGKPSVGEHCVSVSFDVIARRARMHPCLMRSDQDDEVARSLTWQLSNDFRERTQRYVQVMVTDNGPGIDVERMKLRFQTSSAAGHAADAQPEASSHVSSVSNFGICLQKIVCPEIANSHGAMGVHSRIEPSSGCSFLVALPHCSTTVFT